MQRYDKFNRVSLGTRIIAFSWDYVIITGYITLLVGFALILRPWLIPLFTTNPLLAELNGFLFLTLPVYLYFAICEGSNSHATWGKRRMGIVVTGVDGKSIGLRASLIRSAIKFLPWELAHFTIWHMVIPSHFPDYLINSLLAVVYGLVLIYLITPLFSKTKQNVYDYLAGTVVRYRD